VRRRRVFTVPTFPTNERIAISSLLTSQHHLRRQTKHPTPLPALRIQQQHQRQTTSLPMPLPARHPPPLPALQTLPQRRSQPTLLELLRRSQTCARLRSCKLSSRARFIAHTLQIDNLLSYFGKTNLTCRCE
jgi:hypothetical protein